MASSIVAPEIRLYYLTTGNRGLYEALTKQPSAGQGWKISCEMGDEDEFPDNVAVLTSPEQEMLGRIKLSQYTMNDIRALILKDMQVQASQHQGVLPDAPAARVRYQGTTGHKVAAQMLKTYDDPTEAWSLAVEYYQGMDTGHVQLLDGTTVIGSGDVLPINTLISRITGAIRTFRAGVLAGHPDAASKTEIELSPAQSSVPGSLEREEEPIGASLTSPAEPPPILDQPGELPDLPAAHEWVRCLDCGTAHGVERQEGEVQQLLRQCNNCYAERFEPCDAPAEAVTYWVVNPEVAQPVKAESERAAVPPGKASETVGPPNWFRAGRRVRILNSGPEDPGTGTVEQVYGSRADIRRDDGTEVVNLEYYRVVPVDDDVPAGHVAAGIQPAKEPPPGAADSAQAARQVGQVIATDADAVGEGGTLLEIPLGDIGHFPGGNQRTTFNQAKLEELAASIREHGVALPILINEVDGRYILIAGERRLRASHMAGRPTIPARVVRLPEAEALQLMLIENLQREDLNPMDEARAYQRLLAVLGTRERVADRVGMKRVHVTEYLQLLDLPQHLQDRVATKETPVKVGLEYLRRTSDLSEPVKAKVAQALIDERPSTREAPKVIDRILRECGIERPAAPVQSKPQESSSPPPIGSEQPRPEVARATPPAAETPDLPPVRPTLPQASSPQFAQASTPAHPPAPMPAAQPSPPAVPPGPASASVEAHAQPTEDESERQYLERRAAAIRNTLSLGIEADGIIDRNELITSLAEIEEKLAGMNQATSPLPAAPPQPASSTGPAQASTPAPQPSPNPPASSSPAPQPQPYTNMVGLFIGRSVSERFDALRGDRTNSEFLATLMDNWEDSLSK